MEALRQVGRPQSRVVEVRPQLTVEVTIYPRTVKVVLIFQLEMVGRYPGLVSYTIFRYIYSKIP